MTLVLTVFDLVSTCEPLNTTSGVCLTKLPTSAFQRASNKETEQFYSTDSSLTKCVRLFSMFLSVPEKTIWKLDNENILVVMIIRLKRNISIFV